MARPEPGFSLEDLYAEITPDEDNPDGAMTVREICEETGLSEVAVRKRLRKLLAEGKLEATRKRTIDMAGRRQRVAAYRVKEEKD